MSGSHVGVTAGTDLAFPIAFCVFRVLSRLASRDGTDTEKNLLMLIDHIHDTGPFLAIAFGTASALSCTDSFSHQRFPHLHR